jgi:aminoglycoside 3-N-acetyltransferase
MIKQAATYFIPDHLQPYIKQLVQAKKKKPTTRQPLSEMRFCEILSNDLQVAKGGVVFVHSSFDQLEAEFTVFRALAILQDMVGEDGTLLFPTSQLMGRAEVQLQQGITYNVKRSPSFMGILSEIARRNPKAIRSIHPTNSVVAIGPLAEELTNSHGDSTAPCDTFSPYYKAVEHNCQIIGLGVDTSKLTLVHSVEDVMGESFPVQTRSNKRYKTKIVTTYGEKREMNVSATTRRAVWRDIPKFIKNHTSNDLCCDLKIDGRSFFYADANSLFAHMTQCAKQGVTIYPWFIYPWRKLTCNIAR